MIIWALSFDLLFAQEPCGIIGDWTQQSEEHRPKSAVLNVHFDRSNPQLAEVIWPLGASEIVLTSKKAEKLAQAFGGVRLVEVRMSGGKKKHQVAIEQDYRAVIFEKWVELDWSRTTFEESDQGDIVITGIQDRSVEYRSGRRFVARSQRLPGTGMIIGEAEVSECGFFHVRSRPAPLLCTDVAKQFIESLNLDDIDFIEMGETYSGEIRYD